MFDGIEYRGFAQSTVEELAEYASVPVWNGLTDEAHPTQGLADLLTIARASGRPAGEKARLYGRRALQTMANSLMVGCAKMGVNFCVCAPAEFFPDAGLQDVAQEAAAESGAVLEF